MDSPSTAAVITSYRKALIEGGVPEEYANDMARDASARVVQSKGLIVESTLATAGFYSMGLIRGDWVVRLPNDLIVRVGSAPTELELPNGVKCFHTVGVVVAVGKQPKENQGRYYAFVRSAHELVEVLSRPAD